VFRAGARLYIQSRDLRPLDRYFPELGPALLAALPEQAVADGEIVIAGPRGLDFEALQMRLHPAASRVAKLAAAIPAAFVAFDLLAEGRADLRARPQAERRALLEKALAGASGAVHLTPCTRERRVAEEWFGRFEGAGLDGVIAKHESTTYQPGKRAMVKVKHERTADCVVAGFRWHKDGKGERVGSLLLGLHDAAGDLQHVGVTSAFTMEMRRRLAAELAPLRENALASHPWREWAAAQDGSTRMPGAQSRWSAGKDLSWEPVRVERVCEVKYDHLQGDRFRHAAIFVRWRPDKQPADCRYDQLEVVAPAELASLFGVRP
jgi:ATP-dependent DNA ligase